MKYEPKVKKSERNHHVNAGFVIEDLQHAETVIAWQEKRIERLKAENERYKKMERDKWEKLKDMFPGCLEHKEQP